LKKKQKLVHAVHLAVFSLWDEFLLLISIEMHGKLDVCGKPQEVVTDKPWIPLV